MKEAQQHVIAPLPRLSLLIRVLKLVFVAICGVVAFIIARVMTRSRRVQMATYSAPSFAAVVLILSFWLVHPLAMFICSLATGIPVFVPRYLSFTLPGIALAITALAAYFLPVRALKPVALLFAIGTLLVLGDWKHAWPAHHNSGWREASLQINRLHLSADTPILLPSPFIEAQPPTWSPAYPLPSFLYCLWNVYPTVGKPYLLPFQTSPEALAYAAHLSAGALPAAGRFVIYGGDYNVRTWRRWFQAQPALEGWESRPLGPFGDVEAVVFERSARR
jgi:hypothetical protein